MGVLLSLALALSQKLYSTSFTVYVADPVERRVWGVGIKPEEVYFSFSTVYQIGGKEVSAFDFWRTSLKGRVMQVKALRREDFWFASRVNVQEKP